jgi:hypothetical protein
MYNFRRCERSASTNNHQVPLNNKPGVDNDAENDEGMAIVRNQRH